MNRCFQVSAVAALGNLLGVAAALAGSGSGAPAVPQKLSPELAFVPNRGQAPADVAFSARGPEYTILLAKDELALRLRKTSVKMKFVAANLSPEIEGIDRQVGHSNFLIGNDPSKWYVDVPQFSRVQYRELYPGIDLVYYGHNRRLEYDLNVSAGADPNQIEFRFDGVKKIRLSSNGDAILVADDGNLTLIKPRLYQDVNGLKKEVQGHYVRSGSNALKFKVSNYDTGRTLVIDPILNYATYFGGSSDEYGYAVALDANANAYVTGSTNSSDLPTKAAYDASGPGGATDAFVAKLNPTGTSIIYATYLGGSGVDVGQGIAVDSLGNAYITGSTTSVDFPTTNSVFQTGNNGGTHDAFVTKLNAAGNGLVYSTYLGGTGDDIGYGIALDASNEATIAGATSSTNFPTASALQSTYGGGIYDAFLTRLNATGTGLVYSTYLGGSSDDKGYAVAVDSSGNAYITGYEVSPTFPVSLTNIGSDDVFVTAIKPDGTLLYSKLIGGTSADFGFGIAVDGSHNAYVTGNTSSTDYTHTAGVVQTAKSSGYDAFITKLTNSGSISYSTFIGGTGDDYGTAIAVDSSGNAYITGNSSSSNDFPKTADAIQNQVSGVFNSFITKVNATATSLSYSTLFGGSGYGSGYGITVDGAGNAYVAGATTSANFPVTPGAAQPGVAGGYDVFIAKFEPSVQPNPVLSISKTHTGSFTQGQQNASYTVTVSNAIGSGPTSGMVSVADTVPPGMTLASMTGTGWTCPGTAANNCTRTDALAAGQSYPAITVLVNVAPNASSPVINQATVSGGDSATADANDETTIAPSGGGLGVGTSRSFVSTTGNDANVSASCSAAANCRSFAAALSVTNPGGEVVVVNSGGYGAITIDQPVVLSADDVAASISVLTSGVNAITINTAGNVTLNGLGLHGEGIGNDGILVQQVGFLRVYDSHIENFLEDGIHFASSGHLTVEDSAFNDNGNDGVLVQNSSALAFLTDSSFDDNKNAGVEATSGQAAVVNSSALNNVIGFYANGGTLAIQKDRMTFNGAALVVSGTAGLHGAGVLDFSSSLIANNTDAYDVDAGGTLITSAGTTLIQPGQMTHGSISSGPALH